MKLPSNNLNYPIKILTDSCIGSGFIVGTDNNNIYIVTAKHVIYTYNQIRKEYELLSNTIKIQCNMFSEPYEYKPPKEFILDLSRLAKDKLLKFHPTKDIVIIKFGERADSVINHPTGVKTLSNIPGHLVTYELSDSRKFDKVEISNDVFVLGYPASLSSPEMMQIDYDMPLVRKGIISGKNYPKKTLILDCSVYGGNSGGIALEINVLNPNNLIIHLIGVVVEFIPFIEQWRNTRFPELYNTYLQNSGYSIVVPVDFIYELIDEIEK